MNRIDRGILDSLPIAYLVWMVDSGTLRKRFVSLSPLLDERQRRLFAATEASAVGYGGSAAVSRVAGIRPSTIGRGLRELTEEPQLAPGRLRRAGGGRKSLVSQDRGLLADLAFAG